MSKLLILTILLSFPAFGAKGVKPLVKSPIKAFKTASVRLSSTFLQGYESSEILLRIEPKTLKEGKKDIVAQCKSNNLDCTIFPDSQKLSLLNISVRGKSSYIKKLLSWVKTNSLQYSELKHKKK